MAVWLVPSLLGAFAAAQPINFDALDRFFDEEPKIEVTLKGALLRMGARAAATEDPEAAAMMRDIKGIYVRGYPVNGRSMEDVGRKMAGISRNLKSDGWDVITRVRDKESNVYVMVKEGRQEDVIGMLVMVLDMDDDEPMAMFVNIDGKVDPDKIERLTGNLNINGMEYFSSGRRNTRNNVPYVRTVCPDDDEDCIEAPQPPELKERCDEGDENCVEMPKVPKFKEKCNEGEENCMEMPKVPKFKEKCNKGEENCVETPTPLKFKIKCAEDEEDCVPMPVAPRSPSAPTDLECPPPGKPGYKACIKAKRDADRITKPKSSGGQNMNFNDQDWEHPSVQKALRFASVALNLEQGFDQLLNLAGTSFSNIAQASTPAFGHIYQFSDIFSNTPPPVVRVKVKPNIQVQEWVNGNVKVRASYDQNNTTVDINH